MKIALKLILGFLIVASSLTLSFYVVGIYANNKSLEIRVLDRINFAKSAFFTLEERDIKMLSSALEVFIQDEAFKDVYLENNRKKLYEYGQPLFQNLKNRYGITHFYFILPNGTDFVRLHNKEIYGDLITRFTFWKARDTKDVGTGIELGKTAFALRAVMPYYKKGELIGYVELGEEIDHFLEILKRETGDEFAIIAEKQYLDRENWKSVRQTAGLRDNWDDLKDHVVVSNIAEGKAAEACFVEDNLKRVEEGEHLHQQIRAENKTLVCGGFGITDAGGQHAGAVLSLIDVTDQVAITQKSNYTLLSITIILFIASLAIIILISRSISNPITKLDKAAEEVSKGNLDVKVDIKTKDEVGNLAMTFNSMTVKIKNLEQAKKLQKLENELAALEQGYRAKLISAESYGKGKERIENELKIIKGKTPLK